MNSEMLDAAYVKARPIVCRMLLQYPDDVDDVMQESALAAFRFYKDFRGECKFSTWFTRIAISRAQMFLRAQHRFFSPVEDFEVFKSRVRTPEQIAMASEMKNRLAENILKLKPKLRSEALKVVAEISPLNGTMKARRFRARRALREMVAA